MLYPKVKFFSTKEMNSSTDIGVGIVLNILALL